MIFGHHFLTRHVVGTLSSCGGHIIVTWIYYLFISFYFVLLFYFAHTKACVIQLVQYVQKSETIHFKILLSLVDPQGYHVFASLETPTKIRFRFQIGPQFESFNLGLP